MDLNDYFSKLEQPQKVPAPKTPHYYGDDVRILFLIAAFLMLLTLPFFTAYIPVTIWTALLIILGLSLFSGLTNPKIFILAVMDMLIAIAALLYFGYYTIDAYSKYGIRELYFWLNEVLSFIFLMSVYFSVKTFRGFLVDHKKEVIS